MDKETNTVHAVAEVATGKSMEQVTVRTEIIRKEFVHEAPYNRRCRGISHWDCYNGTLMPARIVRKDNGGGVVASSLS